MLIHLHGSKTQSVRLVQYRLMKLAGRKSVTALVAREVQAFLSVQVGSTVVTDIITQIVKENLESPSG
jgi:hypothetical protein